MTLRSLLDGLIYRLKGLKIVCDSADIILLDCLKCGARLEVHKGYGKVRVLCKCGFATSIYTGKDTHFQYKEISAERSPRGRRTYSEEEKRERKVRERHEVFRRHVESDLHALYKVISDKRDITMQGDRQQCEAWLAQPDFKRGYEVVVGYLKKFLDLEKVQIGVIGEPLDNKRRALCDTNRDVAVLGTTYQLPLGPLMLYSIYLNPMFVHKKDVMLATIAHELSHVYATHNNIQFKAPDADRGDLEYSEHMTDLLGVVLGMGSLMSIPTTEDEAHNIGYLTSRMVREATKLWEQEFLSGKDREIKMLLRCKGCEQKLRAPICYLKSKVICPKCRREVVYKSHWTGSA